MFKQFFCLSLLSPASDSQVAVITGTHDYIHLIFVFLVETGFHHVGQNDFHLLSSWSGLLGLPKCWAYRREPLCPAYNVEISLVTRYDSKRHDQRLSGPCSLMRCNTFMVSCILRIIYQYPESLLRSMECTLANCDLMMTRILIKYTPKIKLKIQGQFYKCLCLTKWVNHLINLMPICLYAWCVN